MSEVIVAANDPFDMRVALEGSLRGRSGDMAAHLRELQRDLVLDGARGKLHAYVLPRDANGRYRPEALADFLCERVVDYAIPRRRIAEAFAEHDRTGSSAAIIRLERQARALFARVAQSGEGGELLLFAMAEAVFGLSQILCKMTLKTSPQVHYHGADGVYAEARPDGGLNIYWGESKIYGDPAAAIRECLRSLAPFLVQPTAATATRTRDVLLVNEFANFTDERLVAGLRAALDPNNPTSLSTRHCGIALTAFDCGGYACGTDATLDDIETAIRAELPQWTSNVGNRLSAEGLQTFDLHFICVPMPEAEAFRTYFVSQLGGSA
jgi:hypothetical protein